MRCGGSPWVHTDRGSQRGAGVAQTALSSGTASGHDGGLLWGEESSGALNHGASG